MLSETIGRLVRVRVEGVGVWGWWSVCGSALGLGRAGEGRCAVVVGSASGSTPGIGMSENASGSSRRVPIRGISSVVRSSYK